DADHVDRRFLHARDVVVVNEDRTLAEKLTHREPAEWRQSRTIFARTRRKAVARIDGIDLERPGKTRITHGQDLAASLAGGSPGSPRGGGTRAAAREGADGRDRGARDGGA